MAISAPHYRLMKSLKPILPHGGKLLEIGEANWYGDIDPRMMRELFPAVTAPGSSTIDVDLAEEQLLQEALSARDNFKIAKAFYYALFAPSINHAVDINGSPSALRQDLNRPLRLAHSYDLIINHGTAEHVFNICQVFKSMHDACKVGGLMIHDAPCCGWLDHGFYTLQPTLFYDLAAANGYDLIGVSVYSIRSGETWAIERREQFHQMPMPSDAALFVVMRKDDAADFKLPFQGYYDGALSEEGKQAWENNR